MADVGGAISTAISGGGAGFSTFIYLIVIGGGILVMGGVLAAILFFKKRYNLQVEIKMPRSDGNITVGEWGKGYFDAKKGVCFIKRKGKGFKPIPMKVFDIRKYLQGEGLLTVLQIGPEKYLPVLNESYERYIDDETGEEAAMLNIKVDVGEHKAWQAQWTAAAKNAYSLQTFIQQFQTPIAIGIVIICCFVGFAILWTRVA